MQLIHSIGQGAPDLSRTSALALQQSSVHFTPHEQRVLLSAAPSLPPLCLWKIVVHPLHTYMSYFGPRTFTIGIPGSNGSFAVVDARNASLLGLDSKALIHLYRGAREYKYCEARYGSVFRGRISQLEAAHWRDNPEAPFVEYGAVVSAFFICLCGVHQLLFWRHDSTLLHCIASLFVVNGIGAACAHSSSTMRWHRVDGVSMSLTAWLAAWCARQLAFMTLSSPHFLPPLHLGRGRDARSACSHQLTVLLLCVRLLACPRASSPTFAPPSSYVLLCFRSFLLEEIADNAWRSRRRLGQRMMVRCLIWFVGFFLFYWFSETNGWLFGDIELGDLPAVEEIILVVLPLLISIVSTAFIVKRGWVQNSFVNNEVAAKGMAYFVRGLRTTGIGCAVWIVTELCCDSVVALRYFPGHFVWHCTASYGMTMMLMLGGILRADNFSKVHRLGFAATYHRPTTSKRDLLCTRSWRVHSKSSA